MEVERVLVHEWTETRMPLLPGHGVTRVTVVRRNANESDEQLELAFLGPGDGVLLHVAFPAQDPCCVRSISFPVPIAATTVTWSGWVSSLPNASVLGRPLSLAEAGAVLGWWVAAPIASAATVAARTAAWSHISYERERICTVLRKRDHVYSKFPNTPLSHILGALFRSEARLLLLVAQRLGVHLEHDVKSLILAHLAAPYALPRASFANDLAAHCPAQQSSEYQYGMFPAGLAVLGRVSDFTHTQSETPNAWWQVDLEPKPGESCAVTAVHLVNRLDCAYSRLRDITVTLLDEHERVLHRSETLNPLNVLMDRYNVTYQGPRTLCIEYAAAVRGVRYVRVDRDADLLLRGSGGVGNWDEGYVLSLAAVEVKGSRVEAAEQASSKATPNRSEKEDEEGVDGEIKHGGHKCTLQ
jgi:hypothetical protein